MSTQNSHLNLFRFYSGDEAIENNLTRALALCCMHNPLFLRLFVEKITGSQVADSAFSYLDGSPESCKIDIQVDTQALDAEGSEKVYGVTLATEKFSESQFAQQAKLPNGKGITDLFITLGNVTILIEAKRNDQNCIAQLKAQAGVFEKHEKEAPERVQYCSLTWEDVLGIAEKTKATQGVANQLGLPVPDFIDFIRQRYPSWIPAKPMQFIPTDQKHLYEKRIDEVKAALAERVGQEHVVNQGRSYLKLPWKAASELNFHFLPWGNAPVESFSMNIHLGNTKTQGNHVDWDHRPWESMKHMDVDGKRIPIECVTHVKFSHVMGRHVAHFNIDAPDTALQPGKQLLSNENFYKIAGKRDRADWPGLEQFFDDHFTLEFNWRARVDWEENFPNSGRNYLFLSIGQQIEARIPVETLKDLDRTANDKGQVADLLAAIYWEWEKLFGNKA